MGSNPFFGMIILMWTLIAGYLISVVFKYLLIKLYKNNFSNKSMFLLEIILGWLFHEHIKQDFNVTSGKRFMLKKDFRNRFITQSVKIFRNVFFWIHTINILELGTLISFISFFIYLILNYDSIKKVKINSYTFFILTFLILFLIIRTYRIFDFFFIFQPFFLIFVLILTFICIFSGTYLIYIYIINILKPKYIYYFLYKNFLYFIYIYLTFSLIIFEINFENLLTENFFKELVFKILFFIFKI